jgi:hypothetical protein
LIINEELDENTLEASLTKINNEKIIFFSIRNNQFSNINLFNKLASALESCDSLKSVTISKNNVPSGFKEGMKTIISLFKNNKSIRNINLSNNFIYKDLFSELLKEGLNGSKIYTLDLSCNFLCFNSCRKLAVWLKYHRTLRKLYLQLNQTLNFKREGCEVILESLKLHKNFLVLDVSHMVLTGFGEKMGEFISECKTLKELIIQNTSMNKDDFIHICKAVDKSLTLTTLDLSDNSGAGDEALEYVGMMIATNSSLYTLNMNNINITKKNVKFLRNPLIQNTTIANYSLNNNSKLGFSNLFDVFVKKMNVKMISVKNILEKEFVEKFMKERQDVEVIL